MPYLMSDLVSRLLRVANKGLVGNTGIVRIIDARPEFVEVKIVGYGLTRLLGGFGNGTLKRVYVKRNEGGGGSFHKAFRGLCQ